MHYLIVPLDIFLGFPDDIRPLIDLINLELAPEHQVQLILKNSPEHQALLPEDRIIILENTSTHPEDEAVKRNNLTTSVVAGLAAVVGISSTANAIELNPDGLGNIFSYPGGDDTGNRHHRRTQAAMQQRFKQQPPRIKPRRR